MEFLEKDLQTLIDQGKKQGYLTFEQVVDYLPDEANTPEKLDNLVCAVEAAGIDLCKKAPAKPKSLEGPTADDLKMAEAEVASLNTTALAPLPEKLTRPSDDPIRMYLSQMAEIPLLTRDEEIALAKRIEIARKRFRRCVLSCDYSLRKTVETLKKVYAGDLPFDRTIKVSLTERLTKEQITARMPHHFRTIDYLLLENQRDFAVLINLRSTQEEKSAARTRFVRRRGKLLHLVEELSLRSRRVVPRIDELEKFANRMNWLKTKLDEVRNDPAQQRMAQNLKTELKKLMLETMESPRGILQRARNSRKYHQSFEAAKRELSSSNLRLVVSITQTVPQANDLTFAIGQRL